MNTFLSATADLRANLARLGMAADLDAAQWTAFAALVHRRIGLDLAVPGGQDTGLQDAR
jgi:hypothetical protein